MKVFKQTPNKFVHECILIFFAVSFFAFFINYTLVDSIDRISFLEVIASLFIGTGSSILYGIIKSMFYREKIIQIADNEIRLSGKKLTTIYKFDDIKALDTLTSVIFKLIGIVTVKIETTHRCIYIYLQNKDLQSFLNEMPKKILPIHNENEKSFFKEIKLNLYANLLKTTILFLICSMFILPAALEIVSDKSKDVVWTVSAIIFFMLILWDLILFITRFIKYYGYKYNICEDKINISCGKIVNKNFYLNKDNITAVYFSYNFMSRLFNLYKIKLITRGGGKGLIETNYFPFMMFKKDAEEIVTKLVNKTAISSELIKPEIATILPSLVIWLLPLFFVIIVSIIGSPLLLLLIIPIILFLVQTFKNSGKNIKDGYYILQKGFLSTVRIFIPVSKIERVDAVMTITCRILKMAYMEIYLSGYRAVIFGGYYYKRDFDNFVKNINDLS
jgi:uncharacterized membrane protein YdbT with pleckstrin-like domain